MTSLEEYYNKFNEDKRLLSRHGQVEFNTTMHYINECIDSLQKPRNEIMLADIGAGTGRYSIALADNDIQVTAVELVNYNLGILKKNAGKYLSPDARLEAFHGDARKLKRLKDDSFDITLLLGPMYHLHSMEDKVQSLLEAKRITKPGGYILVAYVMADFAFVKHGIIEGKLKESVEKGSFNEDYSIKSNQEELYDSIRINDIDVINSEAGLKRQKIVAPDGPADYIRHLLNKMDDEEFKVFMDYQLKNAERPDLIGASSHTLDILYK